MSRNQKIAGVVLILVIGLIRLVEAPEYLELATYLGLLFVAAVLGSVVSAFGIARDATAPGWGLGVLVAGGAFVAYLISRTVGLPGLTEAEFFEPLGIISLVVEVFFVVLALGAIRRRA